MTVGKKSIIILACVAGAVLVYFWIKPVGRLQLRLGVEGPEFLDQGWFKNSYYKVEARNGKWGWHQPDGFWVEFATPYEEILRKGDWDLELAPGGKLYQVRKDRLERMEMKNVDRTWYHKDSSTGEWLEMSWDDDY